VTEAISTTAKEIASLPSVARDDEGVFPEMVLFPK
jgi:hypothetical protein